MIIRWVTKWFLFLSDMDDITRKMVIKEKKIFQHCYRTTQPVTEARNK